MPTYWKLRSCRREEAFPPAPSLSTLLKLCNKARVSVTTQGGMTGLVRATMPLAGEIVLSMERMTAIAPDHFVACFAVEDGRAAPL